jgi:hypothetical protein
MACIARSTFTPATAKVSLRVSPRRSRVARRATPARASAAREDAPSDDVPSDAKMISRRAVAALAVGAAALHPLPARAEDIKIVSDKEGFGTKAAKTGDLLLVNYVATIGDGTMVDTTLGGEKFFTNGTQQSVQPAAARPVIVKVNDLITPVPGQPKGLKIGVEGMRVGGVRTFEVPECFGPSGAVRSPYALIPGGATVTYEVTVLRLSDTGPDALFKDVAGCGLGGANTMVNGCDAIVPAE